LSPKNIYNLLQVNQTYLNFTFSARYSSYQQGYELAREIHRFMGAPDLECVYLKGEAEERLLMSGALEGLSFERILEDTERHYREWGGMEKKKVEQGLGRELSMYLQGEEGEEEVLWMRVGIGL